MGDEVILEDEFGEGGEAPEDVSLHDLELVTSEVKIMETPSLRP